MRGLSQRLIYSAILQCFLKSLSANLAQSWTKNTHKPTIIIKKPEYNFFVTYLYIIFSLDSLNHYKKD